MPYPPFFSQLPSQGSVAAGAVDTSASGNTITWRSGNTFSSTWNGQPITVNSVVYTFTFVSPTAGTLSPAPPNQTNVAYGFGTRRYIDQPQWDANIAEHATWSADRNAGGNSLANCAAISGPGPFAQVNFSGFVQAAGGCVSMLTPDGFGGKVGQIGIANLWTPSFSEATITLWGTSQETNRLAVNCNPIWTGFATTSGGGANITWVSGTQFVSAMDGMIIEFNGVDFTFHYVSATTGTLSASTDTRMYGTQPANPGNQTNQYWVFRSYDVVSIEYPGRTVDGISCSMAEFWHNGFWIGGSPGYDLSIVPQWNGAVATQRLRLGIGTTSNMVASYVPLLSMGTEQKISIGPGVEGVVPAAMVDIFSGSAEGVYVRQSATGGRLIFGYDDTHHGGLINAYDGANRPIALGCTFTADGSAPVYIGAGRLSVGPGAASGAVAPGAAMDIFSGGLSDGLFVRQSATGGRLILDYNDTSHYGSMSSYDGAWRPLVLNVGGPVCVGGSTSAGTGSVLNIANLPTSSAGLSSGDVWNSSGTLKVV